MFWNQSVKKIHSEIMTNNERDTLPRTHHGATETVYLAPNARQDSTIRQHSVQGIHLNWHTRSIIRSLISA